MARKHDRQEGSRREQGDAGGVPSALAAKLRRRLAQGRPDEAAEVLDRLWPQAPGAVRVERLRWLLLHWPRRAADELTRAGAATRASVEVLEAFADAALALPPDALAHFAVLGADVLAEAQAARDALDLVCAGRDEAAAERLAALGLRSPFRRARLFVKGLSAWWRGAENDAECVRALTPLCDAPPYAAVARALCAAAGAGEATPAGSRVAATLGGTPPGRAEVEALAALVRERKPSHLLREAARLLGPQGLADARLRTAIARDLPGALHGMGIAAPEVGDRLRRALPRSPGDPDGDRLRAQMLEVAGGAEDAAQSWIDYGDEIAAGRVPFPAADRPFAAAAAHAHAATLLAQVIEGGPGLDVPSFLRDILGFPDSSWEEVVAHLDRAVALDPGCFEHWIALLHAYTKARDTKGHRRALDRFVAAFPDHPRALVAGARGAFERSAFDKALANAERAAALEPLDSAPHDLIVDILLAKARRQVAERRAGTVTKLYARAREVARCTAGARVRALAESGAWASGTGDAATAERVAAAGSAEVGPWLWTAHYTLASQRIFEATLPRPRGRPRRTATATAPRQAPAPPPPPAPPPSAADVSALVHLVAPDERWRLTTLLTAALDRGAHLLTARDDLIAALKVAPSPQIQVRVAERGQTLYPRDPVFAPTRYEAALLAEMPPEYFATAQAEIRAVRACDKPDCTEDHGPSPQLADLLRRIKHHIRSADPKRPARPHRRRASPHPHLPAFE
jgi:hypothetical protein